MEFAYKYKSVILRVIVRSLLYNRNENALLASYRVAFYAANTGKPHSISENCM